MAIFSAVISPRGSFQWTYAIIHKRFTKFSGKGALHGPCHASGWQRNQGWSTVSSGWKLRAQSGADSGSKCESSSQHKDADGGTNTKPALWQRARNWIFGGPLDKERIKGLGLGGVISYGFVSNVSYGICFVIGWGAHVASTGQIPFAGGQWGGFMSRVAGLLVLQQFLRPFRFSVAVALTPFVNRLLESIQQRLSITKPRAFAILLFALALTTLAGFAVSLTAATMMNMP